jgi:hypothetical protein
MTILQQTCTRCGRKLTREPVAGMGPVCARYVLGIKPVRPREKARKPDSRQPDLFQGAAP